MKTITIFFNLFLFVFFIYAQAPVNDLVASAKLIDDMPYADNNVNTHLATAETGGSVGCSLAGGKYVFYKGTPDMLGTLSVQVVSPVGLTSVIIFTAANESATQESDLTFYVNGTNNCGNQTNVSAELIPFQHYYIAVRNEGGPTNVIMNFSCAPANDLIVNAFTASNNSYTDPNIGMNCSNAEEGNSIGCALGNDRESVFYKFQATTQTIVTATISNPVFPSAAIFYEAPSLNCTLENQLTHVNQSTNPCNVSPSVASFSIVTEVGKYYYLILTNNDNTSLTVTGINDPTCAPVNDKVANALTVANNSYTDSNVNILCSGIEQGNTQGGCGTGSTYKTVFYKFQATTNATVTATISNSIYPSIAIFFEAPNLNCTLENQLTYVNQTTNPCDVTPNISHSIIPEVGKYYYIVFSNGQNSSITITGLNSPTGGLEDLQVYDFKYYPNPVNNELSFSASKEISSIQIMNILGQEVGIKIENSINPILDMQRYPSGIYQVFVCIDGKNGNFKVIKN